jgi:hypothetical protein
MSTLGAILPRWTVSALAVIGTPGTALTLSLKKTGPTATWFVMPVRFFSALGFLFFAVHINHYVRSILFV